MNTKKIIKEIYENNSEVRIKEFAKKFKINEKDALEILNAGVREGILFDIDENTFGLKTIVQKFHEQSLEYKKTPKYDEYIKKFQEFLKKFYPEKKTKKKTKKDAKKLKQVKDPKKVKKILRENYEKINAILREYLDMKEEYYSLVSVWIIGTYIYREFESYPYLYINAMRGSGKTRLLKLISSLSSEGELLNSLSEAVLFRATQGKTLCIDEMERIAGKESANLRELLNSGYKKGSKVKRMKKVRSKEGEDYKVQEFDVYRPISMANIWGMDEVLEDRCFRVTLERSNKQQVTKLIEDFSKNELILAIKSDFDRIWCSLCSVVTHNLIYRWNNYIKNKYKSNNKTTYYTYTTNNTNTTLTTSEVDTLNKETKQLFDKIDNSYIDGRHLELAFPLLIISQIIGDEILNKMIKNIKMLVKEKKVDEATESREVLLFDFVSQLPETKKENFTSIRKLTNDFKKFLSEDDEEIKWINTKWFGRALKRLGLFINKRRMQHGIEVTLNIDKAVQKLKMFK